MPNIWNLVFTVVLVAIGSAKCDVNLDSLFHAGVPTAAPVAPAPSKNTIEQQTTSDIPAQNGDVFDEFDREPFMPYRNSRHDEFDWALTKVRSNQATLNMNKLKKKDILLYRSHRMFWTKKMKMQFCRRFWWNCCCRFWVKQPVKARARIENFNRFCRASNQQPKLENYTARHSVRCW